ncbi:MAG: hypothetical protein K0S48_1168 [Ramlibacter sp.]|nr:hypothetical protein [Ramlibacter sp.]
MSLKIVIAAVTAATFSLAFAQGTPPTPASNPAVGKGQTSTQNTPMGTTGTPGGSATGSAAQGSTTGSGAASTAGSSGTMSSGSTASSTPSTSGSSGSMAADTSSSGSGSGSSATMRTAKADRN